jgi:segregation and condensation protein B
LPELPSAGSEDGQITLEMQSAIERLREAEEDLKPEAISS